MKHRNLLSILVAVILCATSIDARAQSSPIASGTANAASTLLLGPNDNTVGFTVTGLTASGATLTVEGSNNAAAASPTWSAIYAATETASATTVTTDGNYRLASAGRSGVRLRVSSTGSGNITVAWTPSSGDVTQTPGGGVVPGITPVKPASLTIIPLDVATVTTGGTAVTALTVGHRTAGGWLTNPKGATIDLCINEQGTASGTTSAGALTCITPGQSYTITPAAGAVSVITSDSSHPFSGMGFN